MENNKKAYRLPPCPQYDVEGMEKWLSDLGEEGLFLAKDGFFAGVATFEKGEPKAVKYRLEPAQKSTSMWADDGGEPDEQQILLSEMFAWGYVGKRGDFYIYRTYDPAARELNTDPQVQSMAYDVGKKRSHGSVITLLILLVIYPLLLVRGGILLMMINIKSWLFLLIVAFVLWMVWDEIKSYLSIKKLQKRLMFEGRLGHGKNWRKGAAAYHGKRAAKIILAIALVCIFLANWSDSIMNVNKIPLKDYDGDIPFATMADLGAESVADYKSTMSGKGFNSIQVWSDCLAPLCINYNEEAAITLESGGTIQGGYDVDYYQGASAAIASRIAKEMYDSAKAEKHFEPMEVPQSITNCDQAYAYMSALHFPTVIVQKGDKVIKAFFYQTSQSHTVPLEQWMGIVANSLDGKD